MCNGAIGVPNDGKTKKKMYHKQHQQRNNSYDIETIPKSCSDNISLDALRVLAHSVPR